MFRIRHALNTHNSFFCVFSSVFTHKERTASFRLSLRASRSGAQHEHDPIVLLMIDILLLLLLQTNTPLLFFRLGSCPIILAMLHQSHPEPERRKQKRQNTRVHVHRYTPDHIPTTTTCTYTSHRSVSSLCTYHGVVLCAKVSVLIRFFSLSLSFFSLLFSLSFCFCAAIAHRYPQAQSVEKFISHTHLKHSFGKVEKDGSIDRIPSSTYHGKVHFQYVFLTRFWKSLKGLEN